MKAPDYDSGWIALAPGASITKTHDLGGDTDNYLVDIQFRGGAQGLRESFLYDSTLPKGGTWDSLTNTQINIARAANDTEAPEIRVRIWTY